MMRQIIFKRWCEILRFCESALIWRDSARMIRFCENTLDSALKIAESA
ncbi:hypothetical protein [Helicobacter sp. 23-1045]